MNLLIGKMNLLKILNNERLLKIYLLIYKNRSNTKMLKNKSVPILKCNFKDEYVNEIFWKIIILLKSIQTNHLKQYK